MDYILQCLRKNGKLSTVAKWENGLMDNFSKWSKSPKQKVFFNFRISGEQKDILINLMKEYDLTFVPNGLSQNPLYSDFSNDLENNEIVDIRNIDTWQDFIKKEKRSEDIVDIEEI